MFGLPSYVSDLSCLACLVMCLHNVAPCKPTKWLLLQLACCALSVVFRSMNCSVLVCRICIAKCCGSVTSLSYTVCLCDLVRFVAESLCICFLACPLSTESIMQLSRHGYRRVSAAVKQVKTSNFCLCLKLPLTNVTYNVFGGTLNPTLPLSPMLNYRCPRSLFVLLAPRLLTEIWVPWSRFQASLLHGCLF